MNALAATDELISLGGAKGWREIVDLIERVVGGKRLTSRTYSILVVHHLLFCDGVCLCLSAFRFRCKFVYQFAEFNCDCVAGSLLDDQRRQVTRAVCAARDSAMDRAILGTDRSGLFGQNEKVVGIAVRRVAFRLYFGGGRNRELSVDRFNLADRVS